MIKKLFTIFLVKSYITFRLMSVFYKQLADKLFRINEAIEIKLNQMSFPICKLAH